MNSSDPNDNDFLDRMAAVTADNLTNPKFGVSMLARELGMSRSNLHRKVNSITKLSVSQFINQVRLKKAKEILRHTSETVSEVTYKVGFNNVSYFIKCFHEYYGYSPGEVGDREPAVNNSSLPILSSNKWKIITLISATFVAVLAFVLFIVFKPLSVEQIDLEKSIAVLPPQINGDDSDSYIIEGIAEAVYNKLALIKDFKKVIPWTSIKQYRDTEKGILEISKELDVNFIVEFNRYVIDDKISFTVSIINTAEHKRIWNQSYVRSFEDIFKLVDEISEVVAETINAKITPEEMKRINKPPTDNLVAYNHYLQGRFLWHRRTKEDLDNSIKHFNKAIELDSTYALAYAGLADAYLALTWRHMYPFEEGYFKSKEYAEKALSINNRLAEAHTILGAIEFWFNWNWEFAEKELQLAIELNPNCAVACQYYSEYLDVMGKWGAASLYIDKAIVLNPNSKIMYAIRSNNYLREGKFIKSLKENEKILEIGSEYYTLWRNFRIYIHLGNDLKAISELQKIIVEDNPEINQNDLLNVIYSESGIEGIIRWSINWLLLKKDADDYYLATLYALLKDKEGTMEHLNKAINTSFRIPRMKYYPDFEFLHDDPRFTALLEKMNLTDK